MRQHRIGKPDITGNVNHLRKGLIEFTGNPEGVEHDSITMSAPWTRVDLVGYRRPSAREDGADISLSYWTGTGAVTNSYPLIVPWVTRWDSRLNKLDSYWRPFPRV
jgi:hypothetical protein